MLIELKHQTHFRYSSPVVESMMEFRLTPATDEGQRLIRHRSRVSGHRPIRLYLDHSGCTVSALCIVPPMTEIDVVFESIVETSDAAWRSHGVTEDWSSPAAERRIYDFKQATRQTELTKAVADYARRFANLNPANVELAARAMADDIHRHFPYRTEVTNSQTTADDLLRIGSGVCQDFSHLMIACARHLGIPARYVSGYILTEGSQAEASASHAWCELLDHNRGWFGIDPTHNIPVGERHIRIGVGRDYADIPPNRGIYRGGAEEEVSVNVSMAVVESGRLEESARRLFTASRTPFATRQQRKPALAPTLLQQMAAQQQQ